LRNAFQTIEPVIDGDRNKLSAAAAIGQAHLRVHVLPTGDICAEL
jgi:hypothetical protein